MAIMLVEEKKEGCSPVETTGATPNPLAAPSDPAATATTVQMPIKTEMQDHKKPPPAVSAAAPVGKTPAGVPNPILMNTSVPLETSPIQVTQMVDDTTTTANANNSIPSPLASPILTADPPSRPASTSTTASTMDAMANAMDGMEPLASEESFEPPTNRRRRANTIHWETSSPTKLQSNESLQPVNFGDGNEQQPQSSMTFSPGSGGPPGSVRKLSNASSTGSSMGMRTTSSGSLYSEYSYDSGSAMGSPRMAASGGPPAVAAAPVSSSSTVPGMGVSRPTAGAVAMHATATARPAMGGTADKRQKRLERNRESARASRRRRKQYLEELEQKVSHLSEEMDRGRMNHACMAVRTIRGMRLGKLREAERALLAKEGRQQPAVAGIGVASRMPPPAPPAAPAGVVATVASHGIKPPTIKSGIQHNVVTSIPTPTPISRPLPPPSSKPINNMSLEQQMALLTTGSLSRTSDELQIVQTFMKQQLLSLVQPTSTKFLLWLSLQKDGFFRGGRSASERLSAARIGERLLQGGTDRAAPNSGMWPLVCHEIGLSYDQEERIRQSQRVVLSNNQTWVHRHTALATKNVIESVHTALGGMQQAAKRREKSLMSILTPEQRVKFLSWASRKQDLLRRLAQSKIKQDGGSRAEDSSDDKYETSPDRHVAANLYIINHQLSKVIQRAPQNIPSFVHPARLKKLSRRPSFESLAGQPNETDGNSNKLRRETSFPSTGSLKRSLNDMAIGEKPGVPNTASGTMLNTSQNNITPESAQVAGQAAVMAVLKDVMPIVPKSALHYSQNPHYVAYPPQAVVSSQPAVVSSSQPLYQPQLQAVPAKPMAQPKRNTTPHQTEPVQSTVQANSATAISVPMTAPSPDPLVDDIPMPTPVSVLLRTSDDFIAPPSVYQPQQHEPLEAVASTPAADFTLPEQVSSYADIAPTPAAGLLSNRHHSAPDFSYPSLLPAPMAMIPESSINPPMMQGEGDIVDFALEDLPEMDADDWEIGEGFDMEVDEQGGL